MRVPWYFCQLETALILTNGNSHLRHSSGDSPLYKDIQRSERERGGKKQEQLEEKCSQEVSIRSLIQHGVRRCVDPQRYRPVRLLGWRQTVVKKDNIQIYSIHLRPDYNWFKRLTLIVVVVQKTTSVAPQTEDQNKHIPPVFLFISLLTSIQAIGFV